MEGSIVTIAILVITGLVTWQGFRRPDVRERLIFRPESILIGREFHRILSSALLHADWWHFGFNAYSFLMFASPIEEYYGAHILLLVYISAIAGGSALSLMLHRHEPYAALGASGGVCGVIFAATFLFPGMGVGLFFIPMPGWVFAIGFVALSFFGVRGRWGNIGHDAHLGGALVGLAVAMVAFPEIVSRSGWQLWAVVAVGSVALIFLIKFPQGINKRLLTGGVHDHKPGLRFQDYDRARERRRERERLDGLLEKIARTGMNSLSASERRELESLSKSRRR